MASSPAQTDPARTGPSHAAPSAPVAPIAPEVHGIQAIISAEDSSPALNSPAPKPASAQSPQPPQPIYLPQSTPHRRGQRLAFEQRLQVWLWGLSAPGILFALCLLWRTHIALPAWIGSAVGLIAIYLLIVSTCMEEIVRPLQTLSNVVAALREDDYSFRARGAQSNDALGELAAEINQLANMLQAQRLSAIEATALLHRVVESMEAPVFAFDSSDRLRLANPAASRLLGRSVESILGESAGSLGLSGLLTQQEDSIVQLRLPAASDASVPAPLDSAGQHAPAPYDPAQLNPAQLNPGQSTRWMLRRSRFRQGGVPHRLLLLSDVGSALREEERKAWQRLIRVLGHELNNSLTPIKSIAGSLRSRLTPPSAHSRGISTLDLAPDLTADFERGLAIIESRAESLHRFLDAYRQLAQLPRPAMRNVFIRPVLERVAALEQRVPVEVSGCPERLLQFDPDQMEQLLINLLRNAAEATLQLQPDSPVPILLSCTCDVHEVTITVTDNGPGLLNSANLFVPFYTTKAGGSGIGLVLARQIAEAHGGSLHLVNRAGTHGCIAELRFPVTAAS